MITHDPSEYIRGLQQLLVSDKKKVAFLFGAGTSLSKKNTNSITIPAIGRMTADIETKLSETSLFETAIKEIKEEITFGKYTIETLKYDHSRKQPYTALGDRLTNFLKQPDTILITCGYSFGDEHINERIE